MKPYRALRPMFERGRWRIVEGDTVVVRGTKFSGQMGKVLAVIQDTRVPQVVVEGVNLRKKRIPAGIATQDEELVVTMEHPIHYSNVNLVEPPPSTSSQQGASSSGSGASTSAAQQQQQPGARSVWPGVRAKFRYDQHGNRVRIGKGKHAAGRIIPWPEPVEEKAVQGGVKDTDLAEAQRPSHGVDGSSSFTAFLASTTLHPPTSVAHAGGAAQGDAGGAAAGRAAGSSSSGGGGGAIGRAPPAAPQPPHRPMHSAAHAGSHHAPAPCSSAALWSAGPFHSFAAQGAAGLLASRGWHGHPHPWHIGRQ